MAIKWPPESDAKLEKEPLPPPKRFIIDEKKEQQEKIVPTKSAEEIQRKINEKIKASEQPVEPPPKKAPPPRPYKQVTCAFVKLFHPTNKQVTSQASKLRLYIQVTWEALHWGLTNRSLRKLPSKALHTGFLQNTSHWGLTNRLLAKHFHWGLTNSYLQNTPHWAEVLQFNWLLAKHPLSS